MKLPDNAVIFEIGANNGSDTLGLHALYPNATIYAFEPDPEMFTELFNKTLEIENIHIYRTAIGNENGHVKFFPSNQRLSGSILQPVAHLEIYPDIKFLEPITVAIFQLDFFLTYFLKADFIDFVWADVQGAELQMISGGRDTFTNKVKYLKTEFNKVEMYQGSPTLEQILTALPDYSLEEVIWECDTEGDALLINRRFK